MKTAVIYARYSSTKQREVSIEDQLRVCHQYAERQGIEVVREYCDFAMSATNDRRPNFQAMISAAPESDYVLVYMMERFSRDKYDAPIYKQRLEKKGVKVISALEYIPDSPEGILIEKLLEGQAAYFSLDLARKVKRGMEGNALKGMSNGYKIFGYDIDKESRKYVINDEEAAVVREIFSRYINGEGIQYIASDLARRGYKSRQHKPASYNFVRGILKNERYTGVYCWGDVRVEGAMPQIIDISTFRDAEQRPRRTVDTITDYPLSGKLYCALCGSPMHGASAYGRHGKRYEYYSCCRNVRREVIEKPLAEALTKVFDDESTARRIAKVVVSNYGEGHAHAAIEACKKRLKDNSKATENIESAIEQGAFTDGLINRLNELQRERENLQAELGKLQAEVLELTEDDLTEFLLHGFNSDSKDFIFGGLLNRAYLFDGYLVATLNFRGETNDLEEVKIAIKECEPAEGFAFDSYGGA